MNCDDVFVILTRGPFPSGSPYDAAVERHLQRCAECYRLAEALRPNDAARRDSTGEQELSSLPGYWGNLVSAPTLSLKDTADFRRPKRATSLYRARPVPPNNLNVGQFAAAVALGIVLAAALRTLVTVTTPKQHTVPIVNPASLLHDRLDNSLDDITAGVPPRTSLDDYRGLNSIESAAERGYPIPMLGDVESSMDPAPNERTISGTRAN